MSLPAPEAGAPVASAAADEATDEAADWAEVSASEAPDAAEEAAEVTDDSAAGVVLVAAVVDESSVVLLPLSSAAYSEQSFDRASQSERVSPVFTAKERDSSAETVTYSLRRPCCRRRGSRRKYPFG